MNKTLFEKAQAFLKSDGTEPMIVNETIAIWADMEPEDGYISIRSWRLDHNKRPVSADKFLTSWDGTQGIITDFFEPEDIVLLAEKYI